MKLLKIQKQLRNKSKGSIKKQLKQWEGKWDKV
jgi:hypothetical protein